MRHRIRAEKADDPVERARDGDILVVVRKHEVEQLAEVFAASLPDAPESMDDWYREALRSIAVDRAKDPVPDAHEHAQDEGAFVMVLQHEMIADVVLRCSAREARGAIVRWCFDSPERLEWDR